jgi:serine/threonine-protein kinase
MVGSYLLTKKIGDGPGWTVYLARDRVLDREVALKLVKPVIAENEISLRDFLREARVAAKLTHPNLVAIYQVDRKDGKVFIATEYMAGGNLADELKKQGPLNWQAATAAIRDAAAGMVAAHEAGILHRDIRPEKLTRDGRGAVKVADFGLARSDSGDPGLTGSLNLSLLGAPPYMSPEQARGERSDVRSDIYSLICTYYELLTGKLPFTGRTAIEQIGQICNAPFPMPPNMPNAVCRILANGSQKQPADRYQSAAALLADLESALAQPDAVPVSTGGSAARPASPLDGAHAPQAGDPAPAKQGAASLLKGRGLAGKLMWLGMAALVALAGGLTFHFTHARHDAADAGTVAANAKTSSDASATPGVPGSAADGSAAVVSPAGNPIFSGPVDRTGSRVADLLPLIDPSADATAGQWSVSGRLLSNQPQRDTVQMLRLPWTPEPTDEFDLHIGFTFREDSAGFRLLLSHAGKHFDVYVDQYGVIGVEEIVTAADKHVHATTKWNPAPVTGVHHDCVLRVRGGTIDVCLDGRRASRHQGYADLAEDPRVKRADDALGIAAWGDTQFGPIELTAIAAIGTFARGGNFASPSMAQASPADSQRQAPGLLREVKTVANIQSAEISPGGRWVAFSTKDTAPSGLAIVDVETGQRVPDVQDGSLCQILPDGKRLLTESRGKYRICDMLSGHELIAMGTAGKGSLITPDGRWVLTYVGPANHPILYDLNSGSESHPGELATQWPRALTPKGDALAAEAKDHHLHLWDTHTARELWQVAEQRVPSQLAFSADGRLLLRRTYFAQAPVDILATGSGEVLAQCGGWTGRCTSAAFSADQKLLVAGCDDAAAGVRLFRLNGDDKKLTAAPAEWPLQADKIGPVEAVAFSPDNRRVLLGCQNHHVRLIDAASGRELADFDQGGEVLQVGFSSDNRFAVSANDTSIRAWRLPNPGGRPAVAAGHPSAASGTSGQSHPEIKPAPPAAVVLPPEHTKLLTDTSALQDSLKKAASLDDCTHVTDAGFALLDRAVAAGDSAVVEMVKKLIQSAAVQSKDIQLNSDVRDRLRQFDSRAKGVNPPSP